MFLMRIPWNYPKPLRQGWLTALSISLMLLTACNLSPKSTPSPNPESLSTQTPASATASPQATATMQPTFTQNLPSQTPDSAVATPLRLAYISSCAGRVNVRRCGNADNVQCPVIAALGHRDEFSVLEEGNWLYIRMSNGTEGYVAAFLTARRRPDPCPVGPIPTASFQPPELIPPLTTPTATPTHTVIVVPPITPTATVNIPDAVQPPPPTNTPTQTFTPVIIVSVTAGP